MSRIEFTFVPFRHPLFGILHRPRAVLALSYEERSLFADFLIDSGADITLVPYHLGRDLGVRLERGESNYTLGGIAAGLPVVYRKIEIRFGDYKIPCRVAWALSDRVPAVLGRLDVFDEFHVEFRQDERKTVFIKV